LLKNHKKHFRLLLNQNVCNIFATVKLLIESLIKEIIMKKYFFIVAMMLPMMLQAQKSSQWRGENRDGVYNETGLLKVWPANGPEMLWSYEGLGDGYTSVAIANGKLYVTGVTDGDLILFVFDLTGKLLTKKTVAKEWTENYPGTRCSVHVNDGKLYIGNSFGQLYCLDETTLNEVWKRDGIAEFGGINIMFGMTENPLIVGDKIFMTPGGEEHNIVALNKHTGALIWTSKGTGGLSSYCSPLYISDQQVPMVVTWVGVSGAGGRGAPNPNQLVAFHVETGALLWSETLPSGNTINPNTPTYSDGFIFTSTGYGGGSWMLRLKDGGRSIEQVWHNEADNQHHGPVKVGDYVYTTAQNNRGFYCIDWKTGETKYKVDHPQSSMVYADGMIYAYDDRGGMSLIKPNPGKFDLAGKFQITLGTAEHWAHPVIHNGVMYIRHGDALMAFKVK
jgi:outer membrane protein assembly factor BamB